LINLIRLQHFYNDARQVVNPWVISGGQPLRFLITSHCGGLTDVNNGTNFYAKMIVDREMYLTLGKVDIP